MTWRVLDTGKRSAAANMELDSALLSDLAVEREATLHLYDWDREAASFGYFAKPEELLDLEEAEKRGLDLARRPTGGGVIFHTVDFAFSVLVPASHPSFSEKSLENYAFVNRGVIKAIEKLFGRQGELLPKEPEVFSASSKHFCMAKPTKYDVMLDGKKVGGAAQRKTRDGFLHQGSIALHFPKEDDLHALLQDKSVLNAMKAHTFPLLDSSASLQEARLELKEALKEVFIDE